jgi:hypothetical protein
MYTNIKNENNYKYANKKINMSKKKKNPSKYEYKKEICIQI